MTSVNTVTSTPTTAAAPAASKKGLGADADTFLTLLVANLRHQDPMAPQDSSAFMAQMAQMSTVEQLTALADGQKRTETLGLLDRTVTFRDTDGTVVSGTVTAVDVDGDPSITVGDRTGIDPASVISVG